MYSAELEKQAMEKQALNPMQLIQMGRRFAARGKMDRFGQLIAKRNKAVMPSSNAYATRARVLDELGPKAYLEQRWLGHVDGPVCKQYAAAAKRYPDDSAMTRYLTRLSKDDPDRFIDMVNLPDAIGPVSHSTLADWSSRLRDMGL